MNGMEWDLDETVLWDVIYVHLENIFVTSNTF